MLKVNLDDGKSLSFDLLDAIKFAEWEEFCRSRINQKRIRVLGILFNSVLHTLPFPRNFKHVSYSGELLRDRRKDNKIVGEMISCQADDIRISLTVYFNNTPKMTRTDIKRVGHLRFNPSFSERKKYGN